MDGVVELVHVATQMMLCCQHRRRPRRQRHVAAAAVEVVPMEEGSAGCLEGHSGGYLGEAAVEAGVSPEGRCGG